MIDPSLFLLADWMMETEDTDNRPVGAVRGDPSPILQEDGIRGYQTGEIPFMQEMPVPAAGAV